MIRLQRLLLPLLIVAAVAFIAYRMVTNRPADPTPAEPMVETAKDARWTVALNHRRLLKGQGMPFRMLLFSPDGDTLATYAETTTLWDAATGRERLRLPDPDPKQTYLFSMAFSPDGKILAEANWDATVRLWDTTSGALLGELKGKTRRVEENNRTSWTNMQCVAFSPDGKTLATALEDETAKLWDVATHKEKAALKEHIGPVYAVAFSPDGHLLATAGHGKREKKNGHDTYSGPGECRLWELTGPEPRLLHTFHPLGGGMAFSPDSQTLALGTMFGIRLMDVTTGKSKAQLVFRETKPGPAETGGSPAFSPDGKRLAFTCHDYNFGLPPEKFFEGMKQTLRFWDLEKGKEQAHLTIPGLLPPVALSADWKRLAIFQWHPSAEPKPISIFLRPEYALQLWNVELAEVKNAGGR